MSKKRMTFFIHDQKIWVISISLTALSPALLLFTHLFIFVMWVIKKKKSNLTLLSEFPPSSRSSGRQSLWQFNFNFLFPSHFFIERVSYILLLSMLSSQDNTDSPSGRTQNHLHSRGTSPIIDIQDLCTGFGVSTFVAREWMCWTASCDVTWVSVSLELKIFLNCNFSSKHSKINL